MTRLPSPPPRRILVIRLGALGDIILARDVFHALRTCHAADRITFLTRPNFAELASQMPWFDEVWTDPKPKWWQVAKWLAWCRRLRAGQFDRVYDLQCNSRTGWYFRLLGWNPPEWVGAAPGCSHPRPDSQGQRLRADEIWFRLVASAGVQRAGSADLTWLDGSVDQFTLPERFVVLVPGCAPHRPYKRWPAQHYAALARLLLSAGYGVVIVGTTADRDAVEEILRLAPTAFNLAGRTTIGQLAALGRRTAAVVGNDTGPVHVLAAVGALTLVVMSGASDPAVMLPSGQAVGCLQRPSLAELTVDNIWRELQHRGLPFVTAGETPAASTGPPCD